MGPIAASPNIPRVYTAIKLAHALGVSVEDIFKL